MTLEPPPLYIIDVPAANIPPGLILPKPQRVQRQRTKGWRMPTNTVYVGRGSRWGNPFKVGRDFTAQECVSKYADMLMPYRHYEPYNSIENFYISRANFDDIVLSLSGKNLACWCAIDEPHCHADFLLRVANNGYDNAS